MTCLLSGGDGTVAGRTLASTFWYFNIEPCAFRSFPEIQGGFVIFKRTEFIENKIVKPWVACGLTMGCMMPDTTPRKYLSCERNVYVYADCHRFDQSVLAILLYTTYGTRLEQHKRSFYGPYYIRCTIGCTWDGDVWCISINEQWLILYIVVLYCLFLIFNLPQPLRLNGRFHR